ncbi:MAG TPA: alpha/beta hydrolase [Cyclobacteriaceae bacterium]|jgi:esterase/lipase|nr:alpha/beta hydrolase [Cyclobacteriaceae bacterium]
MRIAKTSQFKNVEQDKIWFENWVTKLETLNGKQYQRFQLQTALGKTHVWGLNTNDESLESLVIFPGARTTSLFWDFDNGLNHLTGKLKIFLIETNGLPNLSDGSTPDIKSLDYGEWASEVLDKLNVKRAFIAGASFGGLIAMKLSIVAPSKVRAAFLLNPGCLQSFSLSWRNLYYNLLPIFSPTRKNVLTFLDKAIFCKPYHQLSAKAEELIVEYEVFALTRYKDNTQKPYDMSEELRRVKVDTFLLEGDKDLLFPYQTSVTNAKKKIQSLKGVEVFENVGHGIETYNKAIQYMDLKIKNYLEI